MNIIKHDKKAFTVSYDSIEAYLHQVEHGDVLNNARDQRKLVPTPEHSSWKWAGAVDLQGALNLARLGYSEGTQKLSVALAGAKSQVARAPAYTMDVAGAHPAAHLAAAGDPACMVSFLPNQDRHRPIVKLAVAGNMLAENSPEKFRTYGAALVSYVDALETAGSRVELYKVMTVETGVRNWFTTLVKLKSPEQPLELDRMAALFIHPASLRRIEFHHRSMFKSDVIGSYERTKTARKGIDIDDDFLLLPPIDSLPGVSTTTVDRCIAAIKPYVDEQLTDLGLAGLEFEP